MPWVLVFIKLCASGFMNSVDTGVAKSAALAHSPVGFWCLCFWGSAPLQIQRCHWLYYGLWEPCSDWCSVGSWGLWTCIHAPISRITRLLVVLATCASIHLRFLNACLISFRGSHCQCLENAATGHFSNINLNVLADSIILGPWITDMLQILFSKKYSLKTNDCL